MEDRVREILKDFNLLSNEITYLIKGFGVFYMPNPGNFGDALIHQGTVRFLEDSKIEFDIINPQEHYLYYLKRVLKKGKRSVLIYGGGGAWCSMWHYPVDLLNDSRFRGLFSKIIVLPSTYERTVKRRKIFYFSRDKFESLRNNREASFSHDMALYLCKDYYSIDPLGSQVGFFFRTDKESKNAIKIPENNIDLSTLGNHKSDIDLFFKLLSPYRILHTDRLHVAIAGCILGKIVNLYPGSYFKNYAVYKSSLSSFSNLKFNSEYINDDLSNYLHI